MANRGFKLMILEGDQHIDQPRNIYPLRDRVDLSEMENAKVEELVNKYKGMIRAYVKRYGRSFLDVDFVVDSEVVNTLLKLASEHSPERPDFPTVLRHRLRNAIGARWNRNMVALCRDQRQEVVYPETDVDLMSDAVMHSPEFEFIRSELEELVRDNLETRDERRLYREMMNLSDPKRMGRILRDRRQFNSTRVTWGDWTKYLGWTLRRFRNALGGVRVTVAYATGRYDLMRLARGTF
jgi:hypothetical protein